MLLDDSDQASAYNNYQNGGVQPEHEASFAHELIAGAASYEAAKAYEKHCEQNGKKGLRLLAEDIKKD